MLASRRASHTRASASLTKESLKAELLRHLPQLAHTLAAQLDSPARMSSDALLADLLNSVTDLLHVHLPPELTKAARDQLLELCRRAENGARTLESSVGDFRELAVSKVNIGILGASVENVDRQALDSVKGVASSGGIVRKLATEALWLSSLIEILNERRPCTRGEVLSRAVLPDISDDAFARICSQAEQIVEARRAFYDEPELSFPSQAIGVRTPHRDRQRALVLQDFSIASSTQQKVQLLKRLRRDTHPDARNVLIQCAQDVSADLHLREVCCCLLEEIADDVSALDGDEIGRHLLVRLTQHLVSRKFTLPDISILLRLLSKFGRLDSAAVLTQLLEDSQLRESTKGSEHEMAVLLLVLSLLGRGGTATRCLETMVLGMGLEHLSVSQSIAVRRSAVVALAGQVGGISKLVQLLEFYGEAPSEDGVVSQIADCLSCNDDSDKVAQLVAIFEESMEAKSARREAHVVRVVRGLRNTRNPRAFSALTKVLLDKTAAMAIRQECALALTNLRGDAIMQLTYAFENAAGPDRLLILSALRGNSDASRYELFLAALCRPVESSEFATTLKEKIDALSTIREWKIV